MKRRTLFHLLMYWTMIIYVDLHVVKALSSQTNSGVRPPRITEHPSDLIVQRNEPATLKCKADGKSLIHIEWYKDGELVRTSPADPKSHRLLLDDGSLFFLKVVQGRKEQDAGTYWCVARNDGGRTTSKNASLEIAVLRDDFLVAPKNVKAAVGETATIVCLPPKGHPEPTVRWKKNGEILQLPNNNRIHISDGGNLVISDVRLTDAGRFICVAENMVGKRESVSAVLSVHVKPNFLKMPEDVTAIANETVTFECKVAGDPVPTIIWRRQDGKMPIGRAQIQEDKSLKIEHVTPTDEGEYICEAENVVGSVIASATLVVHSRPTFTIKPKDKKVSLNAIATFSCDTSGNPPPAVFWTKEGSQVLMFPGQPHGRFSVSSDGELKITGVLREDEGYYVCSALSVAGSSMSKAYLEVTAMADTPPPIIRLGPANQTLPMKSVATLPCQASGNPQPTIRWLINGHSFTTNNPRMTLLDSGSLQINDLQASDSGLYTCTASSESGETSWSASLSVESPTNPNVIFHRTPDLATFPGPPGKPVMINVSESSVALQWRKNGKIGQSQLIGYTVEYFSNDLQTGWVVSAHRVSGEAYVVSNLRPDTTYLFLVRAENSHGLSVPSPVSDVIQTMGSRRKLPDHDMDEARIKLSNNVVVLKEVKALSSTAIKLTWDLKIEEEYVEGFYIRFRDMSGGSQKYNMVTVLNAGATSYIITNLKKYTKYEFFFVPFFKTIEGQPSNSQVEQTLEDVPSAPPDAVQVRFLNSTSVQISWAPPPPQHRNGVLRGYQIIVRYNSTHVHSNATANATTTTISLSHLKSGTTYMIVIVSYTSIGFGPYSTPYMLQMDDNIVVSEHAGGSYHSFNSVMKQPWVIALIGGLLFLLLFIFCAIIFMRRRAARKKAMGGTLIADDLTRASMNPRDALWIDRGWRMMDTDKDSNLSETKLLNCAANDLNSVPDYAEVDTRNLKTFYKREPATVPAPYATTTLINSVQKRLNVAQEVGDRGMSAMLPTLDGKTSGSDDSCLKPEMSSDSKSEHSHSTYNADYVGDCGEAGSPTSDSGSLTTDENGMPIKKKRMKMFRPNTKQALVNWVELLPPPPEHPPPNSDRGSPSSTLNPQKSLLANKALKSHIPQSPQSLYRQMNFPNRGVVGSGNVGLNSPSVGKRISPRSTPLYADSERIPTPPTRTFKPHLWMNGETGPDHCDQGEYSLASNSSAIYNCIPNPLMECGVQSSLPSLVNEPLNRVYNSANGPHYRMDHCESAPGRNDFESDAEGTVDYCDIDHYDYAGGHTSQSSVAGGDMDFDSKGMPVASWASMAGNSSCTSARSSAASSSDGSFYTEADFAAMLNHHGDNSVNDGTLKDTHPCQKHILSLRYRQKRSTSPYSTDSSYSTITDQQRPFLKAQRKRQMSDGNPNSEDIPIYNRPSFATPSQSPAQSQSSSLSSKKKHQIVQQHNKPSMVVVSDASPYSTSHAYPMNGHSTFLQTNDKMAVNCAKAINASQERNVAAV
ncbi:hypothetical protein CHUAL_007213 [Chamberlinius hualienensis]